ncbi:MAG: isocitrate/isopropylmalate family dehydrogenase [Alphaproteobacteria bacterium]|nr:isocitrate/isopropylmalate family dehydrogenase [Alphaproteobacteria bacterium]
MPGDGIGPEVMEPTLGLLKSVAGDALEFETYESGAGLYARTGETLSKETLEGAGAADAILLAAMGLPDVRYPDGREIAPQVELREIFHLYAGVRPVKTIPGAPIPLGDPRAQKLDFVLIRESTEGLFWERGKVARDGDREARSIMRISRDTCVQLFDFAFELGRSRKAQGLPGRVTCVDKANVLDAMVFFREVFDERAKLFPEVTADHRYVDAMALDMVRRPWDYDVLVTENMFGDILSDLGAGLMGGLGMAPSADIGDKHAVFQPCHGTAPDIMGQGKANPTAMILSAAMMLDWLGRRHDDADLVDAGGRLSAAVDAAYAPGTLAPVEFGGAAGTAVISDAVAKGL